MAMIGKWMRGASAGGPAPSTPAGMHPLVAFSVHAPPAGRYGAVRLELAADLSLAPTFTVQPMVSAAGARELAGALLALADRLDRDEGPG